MKPVILLYPPPSDPTQPYTSVPTLTAHLRSHGFEVEQRDVGIECLNAICQPAYLKAALVRADSLSAEHFSHQEYPAFLARRKAATALWLLVEQGIDQAMRLIRSKSTYSDLALYRWAASIIGHATNIASLPYHPTQLLPNEYKGNIDYSKAGVFEAVFNEKENVFRGIFRDTVVPSVLERNPLLIGISITYHFQLIPALTLAAEIRRSNPRVPVVIGGALLARMEDHLKCDVDWFAFADHYVVGEGETALLSIAESEAYETKLLNAPNVISRVGSKTTYGDTCFTEDFAGLPCPDYRGLDLDAYLSPEPVLLMPTTRGCYYGKCTFCDVSRQTRTIYRPLDRSDVAENVRTLHHRHGAKRFFFCDDAVPMKHMLEIAELVEKEMPFLTWQAEARLERPMTLDFMTKIYRGGCRQLIFGFESASQRILDLMKKHNTVESDRAILKACNDAGIAVNLQTFIGLPGETRQEAQATINHIVANEKTIASIGFGVFSLYKDTPIYNFPEKYNVESIYSPLRGNLLSSLEFTPTSGMSRQDADCLYEEAMENFRNIFTTRSHMVGGASGSHSLLQLTYQSSDALYAQWQEVDSMRHDEHWMHWIPNRARLIFGQHVGNKVSLVNTTTAQHVEVGLFELDVAKLCDGRRTIEEIASQVADDEEGGANFAACFFRSAKTLRTLVCSGILDTVKTVIEPSQVLADSDTYA